MQFIDQSLPQILPDGRRSAADADILSVGGFARSFEGDAYSLGDEMKGRAALHDEWRPRMMSEHENRLLIHRVITPPTSPTLIEPGTADGSEHIPAHDPGTDIVETPRGKVVINPGLSALVAEQLRLKRASSERPSMKGLSAEAQRVLQALIQPCAEAINRNGEAFYTEFSHMFVFAVGMFWQRRSVA